MRHESIRCRLLGIAAAAIASAVLAPAASAAPSFSSPTNVNALSGAIAAAVGDFNGDGRQDFAVADAGQAKVSVRLGTGTGSFTGDNVSNTNYDTHGSPGAIVAADFNQDGKTDLATANGGTNDVSVLIGHGDGSFAAPVHFTAGNNPGALATGDFDEDGKLDLAVGVSDAVNGHVLVLLGNGAGAFSAPTSFAAHQSPSAVRVADVNRDGHDDLVVANASSGDVSVLLGNGAGSFAAHVDYPMATTLRGLAVGDFDGDGNEDVAATSPSDGTVVVRLGSASGALAAPNSYQADNNPDKIAAADFDRDGHLDLAVADQGNDDVSVLLGTGGGAFAAPANFGAHHQPRDVVTADFDGDGRQDVAVVNAATDDVSVLRNTTSVPTLAQLGAPNGFLSVSGFAPTDVAVSPEVAGSPSNVYLGSPQGIVVFNRDPATGVLTRAGCLNAGGTDGCTLLPGLGSTIDGQLAISRDGKSVYMATGTALLTLTRNTSTGALVPAGCVNQNGAGGCATSRQGSSFTPDWVRIGPEDTSAYVGPPANQAGGVMSVFTRNTTSGALTQPAGAAGCISDDGSDGNAGTCTQVDELANQTDIAFSRSGTRAWISSHSSATVVGFTRDTATGALTPGTGGARCVVDADAASADPACASARALKGAGRLVRAGRNLYVTTANGTDDGVAAFEIDAGGRLAQLPGASGCVTTSGHDGDVPPGDCTPARVTTGGGDMRDPRELVATPNGLELYVEGESNGAITTLARDATTGALSDVGCVGDNTNGASCTKGSGMLDLDGIAISPDGRNVYGSTVAGIVALTRHLRHSVSGSANPAGGGSVAATSSSPNASCGGASCSVEEGGSVTLTPTAASGYRFSGWSGVCASQQGPCAVQNVTSDQSATANFAKRVTVSATASPTAGGSISAASQAGSASCSGASCTVDAGSIVTLTVTPASGYRFDHWDGACSGGGGSSTCSVSDTAADRSATATFVRRYTVAGTGSPAGGGAVIATSPAQNSACNGGSCVVDGGSTVTLLANPASGYKFKSWSGACTTTSQTCTLSNVASDLTSTALFEPLAATTSTGGSSTTTAGGDGSVKTGITLTCKKPCVVIGIGKVTLQKALVQKALVPNRAARSGGARKVTLTIAKASKHLKAGNPTVVVLKLTAKGKKLLKLLHKVRMKVSVTATAAAAAPATAHRTLTVKAPKKRKGH